MKRTGRRAIVFLIAVWSGFTLPTATAKQCAFHAGAVGELRIGMSTELLVRKLGHEVKLQFAGDRRSGLTIDGRNDLSKLKLSGSMGVEVSAADVFFVSELRQSEVVDMISLEIPCQFVNVLRMQCEAAGVAVANTGKANWRTTGEGNQFVWGADVIPTCRFWLRAR